MPLLTEASTATPAGLRTPAKSTVLYTKFITLTKTIQVTSPAVTITSTVRPKETQQASVCSSKKVIPGEQSLISQEPYPKQYFEVSPMRGGKKGLVVQFRDAHGNPRRINIILAKTASGGGGALPQTVTQTESTPATRVSTKTNIVRATATAQIAEASARAHVYTATEKPSSEAAVETPLIPKVTGEANKEAKKCSEVIGDLNKKLDRYKHAIMKIDERARRDKHEIAKLWGIIKDQKRKGVGGDAPADRNPQAL